MRKRVCLAVKDGALKLGLKVGDGRLCDVFCNMLCVLLPELETEVQHLFVRNGGKTVSPRPMGHSRFQLVEVVPF